MRESLGLLRREFAGSSLPLAPDKAVEKGILLASGLVAGDALIGIVIGIFAAIGTDIAFGLKLFPVIAGSNLVAFVMFLLLAIWMYLYSTKKD